MSNSGRVFNVNCATRTTDLAAFPIYHIYSCGDIVSNYPSSVKNYSVSWKAVKTLSWVIQWPPCKRSWLGSIPSTTYLWYPKSQGALLVLQRDKNVRRKHTQRQRTHQQKVSDKKGRYTQVNSWKLRGGRSYVRLHAETSWKWWLSRHMLHLSVYVLIQWQFCRVALEVSWKEIKK